MAHGLNVIRDLLAVPTLSDHTRSFLSLFCTSIYEDWNKAESAEVKKLESQLKICLKSPDVLKTVRGISITLSQAFHFDLPDYLHLADGVNYYDIIPTGAGGLSPTIITPTKQLRNRCTSQLYTTPDPQGHPRSSRLTILLRLLHGSQPRTAAAFSGQNLPSGFDMRINNLLVESRDGSLVKDVTSQLESHNGLEVEIQATSRDRGKTLHFAVAIERWHVWSRHEIIEACRKISKEEVLKSIATSLAPSRSATADVIETTSVIKIDLFEPFSQSRIFDIPVRGADCRHRDAFDLRVFLETRFTPLNTGRLPLNNWRCPVCSSECTPEKLVKDGFLMEVRECLRVKEQLSTRFIIVDHRGNWQRVVENAVRAVVLDAGV